MVNRERLFEMKIDENTALACVFSNTHRKKRSIDLVTLAENVAFLKELYKTIDSVSKKTDLSKEMLRELLLPLELPDEIKRLVRERKIDRIGHIVEISKIKDREKQLEFSLSLAGFSTDDIRDIRRISKVSHVDIKTASNTISSLKSKGIHVIIFDADDKLYKFLSMRSRTTGLKIPELVKKLLTECFLQGGRNE